MKKKNSLQKQACAIMLAAAVVVPSLPVPYALAAEPSSAPSDNLDIALHLELPTKKDFTVTLTGNGETRNAMLHSTETQASYTGRFAPGEYQLEIRAEGYLPYTQTVTIKKGMVTRLELHNSHQVNDVLERRFAPGEYQLEIRAEGYLPYTQTVTIKKGMVTRLELHNSHQVNDVLETQRSEKRYGVMAVGDVTRDGMIDSADAEQMMDAIDAGSNEAQYDLNGDTKVNVGDLTYITINYGKNITASPMYILSGEQLTPEAENAKVEHGKLEDLTTGKDSFVQLAPKNGAAISESNPVEVSLAVADAPDAPTPKVDGLVIVPPAGTENCITDASIEVEGSDGETYLAVLGGAAPAAARAKTATAAQESDGTIVVNLGEQIAIKKVTIRVTGASTNLVDIAQVEFVNGMENRIPEPELNIPKIRELKQLSAGNNPSFSVTWEPQVNVTGYEVSVRAEGKETVSETAATTLTVTDLGGKLKTYVPYTIRVRSTNGQWKSPYSEPQTITLKPESAPPAPESVSVTGDAEAIQVKWKSMRDTQTYSVHYRAQGESSFQSVSGITGTSHTLTGLRAKTTYEVYVLGHNELGASPQSEIKQATTLEAAKLVLPNYKRINTSSGAGQPTAHIAGITLNAFQAEQAFAIADDDLGTYATANTWDTGGFNTGKGGPVITLDQEYEIDTVRFAARVGQGTYPYIRVYCWDEAGNMTRVIGNSSPNSGDSVGRIQNKKDANGNPYQVLKFNKPQKVKRLQLCVANGLASGNNTISEIAFYHYDSLENDIEALFTDDTHIALRDGVNRNMLDALQERLDTPDPVSGELHPDKGALQLVLKDAYALLDGNLDTTVIPVDNQITAGADKHLDFAAPLSDLQPLGRAVQAGETINVYVGAPNQKQGANTNLNLVFTQNYGESSQWSSEVSLKVGTNSITAPDISKRVSESGGAIYVRYTGTAGRERYNIRVTGGTPIPLLNVDGKRGDARTQAVADYVKKLESHVAALESGHQQAAQGDNSVHQNDYNPETCILNYTDIALDGMMYSVPASQVWNALKNASDPAAQLERALAAMEQELELFYQHRGLHSKATGTNRMPAQRQNIRYQKMFDGAFMYAGGKHIGIGYGSVGELFCITPVTTDEMGNKTGGSLTGWGIAHEIGHVINSGKYAVAETTNNYYSILSTGDTRSDYGKVYRAVTSGGPSDEATALAMYWQLHMFYDPYGNYKTFGTTEEQLANLFFARVDSYARKPDSAPQPNTVALTLDGSKSDNLIRLACAAAEKNLLPFFEAWGFAYNDTTAQYAAQFPSETHPVQYISPEAHAYKLAGGKGMDAGTQAKVTLSYSGTGTHSNQVALTLSHTGSADDMLGYEIRRNGEAVAFVPATEHSYTDTITVGNNRVYQYEVIAYDKLLNATDPARPAPVKVTHDGTLGRDKWTAETNMVSEADEKIEADGNNGYCTDTVISAISRVIDGTGGYTGKVTENAVHPEIVLKLGKVNQITALRYKGDHTALRISVSADGEHWESVRTVSAAELNESSSNLTVHEDGSKTIYFENPNDKGNLYICESNYVKLELTDVGKDTPVSIQNIDLLGPAGDNVEWQSTGSIGVLKTAYEYSAGQFIPEGSVIFTGTYQGNPAYNVVLLKDADGGIVGGIDAEGAIRAQQIILAPAPEGDQLGNIANGSWIYWIEPQDLPAELPGKVMAELYRVDNAMTMEGQRLVSDTLYLDVPDTLPKIELTDANQPSASSARSPKIAARSKMPAVGAVQAAAVKAAPAAFHAEAPAAPAQEASAPVHTVRTVSVRSTTGGSPEFTLTQVSGDAKKAQAVLRLGDAAEPAIAMQTAFEVSEGVTGVDMYWASGIEEHALLKACRYHPETKTVTVYITAKQDLLKDGALELGTVSMRSAHGTNSATLTLKQGSTVVVNAGNYITAPVTVKTPSVTLETDEASGSSSSGSTAHAITVAESAHGTVTVNPKRAEKGDTVTVSAVSDTGYVLDRLTVTDSKGNTVRLTDLGEGKFSFTMPGSKVTISAAFRPAENAPETGFTDVADGAYYADAVQWAVSQGITAGTSTDKFSPNAACTRAQMVTFLWRAHGSPVVDEAMDFTDVPADAYYTEAVRWAVSKGIASGTSTTTFSPNATVTRAQTVAFLHRAAGTPAADSSSFADVRADAYYADAVAWAVAEDITAGTSADRFSPDAACTRAQIVTFLYRAQ